MPAETRRSHIVSWVTVSFPSEAHLHAEFLCSWVEIWEIYQFTVQCQCQATFLFCLFIALIKSPHPCTILYIFTTDIFHRIWFVSEAEHAFFIYHNVNYRLSIFLFGGMKGGLQWYFRAYFIR